MVLPTFWGDNAPSDRVTPRHFKPRKPDMPPVSGALAL
jgi:hypothetical protein